MKIGHRTWNLGLPMMEAIDAAGEMGFDGVSLIAHQQAVWPPELTGSRAGEIRSRCARNGLEISALTGRFGSLIGEGADENLQWSLSVVEAASALEIPVATSHIGVIPEDLTRDDVRAMMQRVRTLCDRGDELGVTIGVETGPESAEVLRDFIEEVGSPRLRVNYDPANLLMKGFEHIGGVEVLAPYIVHTHAKDAVREDPDGRRQRPLGEGDVDIPLWVDTLRSVGYDGWLCIERESGEDRLGDARRGLALLRTLV
ncbi:MAG: sugar phosphate isomerase/epimerase family protein [Armatimonadota bacterium]